MSLEASRAEEAHVDSSCRLNLSLCAESVAIVSARRRGDPSESRSQRTADDTAKTPPHHTTSHARHLQISEGFLIFFDEFGRREKGPFFITASVVLSFSFSACPLFLLFDPASFVPLLPLFASVNAS